MLPFGQDLAQPYMDMHILRALSRDMEYPHWHYLPAQISVPHNDEPINQQL
jgi:hypothetical protein